MNPPTNDLLDLARVASTELSRERVNLSALAREVWEDRQRGDPAREVAFSIKWKKARGVAARSLPHTHGEGEFGSGDDPQLPEDSLRGFGHPRRDCKALGGELSHLRL